MFEKYSNINFHENPSRWSLSVPCRLIDRLTYMTKLVYFRSFVGTSVGLFCTFGFTSYLVNLFSNYGKLFFKKDCDPVKRVSVFGGASNRSFFL